MHTSCKRALLLCLGAFAFEASHIAVAAAQEAPPPSAAEPPGPAGSPPTPTGAQTEAAGSPAETPRSDAALAVLVPPRLIKSAPPVYPEAHLAHGEHPTVVLKVTVLASGQPADVAVEHSAGPDFDAAAVAAVSGWRFEPARRGELAIASRVGVAVHFELPELSVVDVVAVTSAEAAVPHPHDEPRPDPGDVPADAYGASAVVDAELRAEGRSASDIRIDARVLHAAPRSDAGDLLTTAPGLVAARIEGDGVAHRLMLRGFDADHGQDIALSVDGVPINQVSHIHGQGYADVGFVIPEVVRSLRVIEGVYDPAQGDFSVAGSADFELGVERRGLSLSSSYGRFDSFRELAVLAPEGMSKDSFLALSFKKSHGFGQNRAGLNGSLLGQLAFGRERLKLLLTGGVYAARYDTANLVRRDDVSAGRIGFYDVYPYASTRAQGAFAGRAQLSAKLRYLGDHGDNAELQLAYVLSDFRLLANYTGFVESSQRDPRLSGLGDLNEQLNRTSTLFARGRYRTRAYRLARFSELRVELGTSGRFDRIAQRQALLEVPGNVPWDERVDAGISAYDVGAYVDLDLSLTRYVRLKGGLRGDLLAYGVDDALTPEGVGRAQSVAGDQPPAAGLSGYRRSAAGLATGPRAVLELTPVDALTLSVAYGEGFRSPQARAVTDGGRVPFTTVRSADLGARVALGREGAYGLRASGFYTHVGNDIAFDPEQGAPSPIGATTRRGVVLYGDLRPRPWLTAAGSVTYARATVDNPPAATADEPSAAYHRGGLVPYIPPWVGRLDSRAEQPLGTLGGQRVRGHVSAGLTVWSRRPLPYAASTPAVSLLDLGLGAQAGAVHADLSLLNVLDTRYAAIELVAVSNFDPAGVPSRLPARHIGAGAPRTYLLTLGVDL